MTPDRVEYFIGRTRHGQPIRLVREKASDGVKQWTIHKDAANQRDDSAVISGLDAEILQRMAAATFNTP